jgi:flap endonuclease-1
MGIKRLNKFLEYKDVLKYHKNICDYIKSLKTDGYQCFNTRNDKFIVGVDLLLYAHKYKYSCDNIYIGFINQILNFLSNKIIPIYIIDGVAPSEKSKTLELRSNKKMRMSNKIDILTDKLNNLDNDDEDYNTISSEITKLNKSNINISASEINKLIELFDIFNIPYIRASGEADTMISRLYKNKIINTCLSEDMDLLVFGCKKMIKFKSNMIVEYDLDYIQKKLQLNNNEFIELCILFGCDYLKPLLRLNPNEIYDKYINTNNIITLFDDSIDNNIIKNYLIEYDATKKIFMDIDKNEIVPYIIFKLQQIDVQQINNFMNNNCNNNCNKESNNNNNITYQLTHINELIKNKQFGI